jgi:Tol biopolymer transport system component
MGGHHVLGPDGTLYFECRAKNYRAVIGMVKPRAPGDPPRVFFDNGRWNHHFSVSPDGKRMVWSSDMPPNDEGTPEEGMILLADLDGSHVEKLIDVAHSHPYFSRDGRAVLFDAIMTDRSEMYRLDLATHKLVQLTHSAPRYWSGPQEIPE